MLGIRQYKGASIDLYLGDQTLFVCDAMVIVDKSMDHADQLVVGAAEQLPASFVFRVGVASSVLDIFEAADQKMLRHVTLPPLSESDLDPANAKHLMSKVRQYLENRSVAKLRRITIVLENMGDYNLMQDALFAEFPEVI